MKRPLRNGYLTIIQFHGINALNAIIPLMPIQRKEKKRIQFQKENFNFYIKNILINI